MADTSGNLLHSNKLEIRSPVAVTVVPNAPSTSESARIAINNVYPRSTAASGLESLTPLTQLIIEKDVKGLCIGTTTFRIKSNPSETIFSSVEESSGSTRCFWGPWRSFEMKIFNNFGEEIIRLHRCDRTVGCSSLPQICVFSPPDTLVATIQEEFSCNRPIYTIKNANRETVLTIEGPCCSIPCFRDVHFQVLSSSWGLQVAKITKEWVGIFSCSDNFSRYNVHFPEDMDVRVKAGMIGACVLIDNSYQLRTAKFAIYLILLLAAFNLIFYIVMLNNVGGGEDHSSSTYRVVPYNGFHCYGNDC